MDVVSCGAVRISDVVWLSSLPPITQLSQARVGRSMTSLTGREGFLNTGVYSTFSRYVVKFLSIMMYPFLQ